MSLKIHSISALWVLAPESIQGKHVVASFVQNYRFYSCVYAERRDPSVTHSATVIYTRKSHSLAYSRYSGDDAINIHGIYD